MGSFERIVRSDLTPSESFTSFVEEVEPRFKRALCVGFGIELAHVGAFGEVLT